MIKTHQRLEIIKKIKKKIINKINTKTENPVKDRPSLHFELCCFCLLFVYFLFLFCLFFVYFLFLFCFFSVSFLFIFCLFFVFFPRVFTENLISRPAFARTEKKQNK